MSLVEKINSLITRYLCQGCELTWNKSEKLRCKSCNKFSDQEHPRCKGCNHIFKRTTLSSFNLCGICSNIYEPKMRQGMCGKSIGKYMKNKPWYLEKVDRVKSECDSDGYIVGCDGNRTDEFYSCGYLKDGFVV